MAVRYWPVRSTTRCPGRTRRARAVLWGSHTPVGGPEVNRVTWSGHPDRYRGCTSIAAPPLPVLIWAVPVVIVRMGASRWARPDRYCRRELSWASTRPGPNAVTSAPRYRLS